MERAKDFSIILDDVSIVSYHGDLLPGYLVNILPCDPRLTSASAENTPLLWRPNKSVSSSPELEI